MMPVSQQLVSKMHKHLEKCDLCPRKCGVNRMSGVQGYCRAGVFPKIASINLHFGEEPPLVGKGGSGTVFFCNCTMKCIFCQNYPISQLGNGNLYSAEEFSRNILKLQEKGAVNLNLVTPTPHLPFFLEGLHLSEQSGFHLPVVYNTSGYENSEIIRELDGIVTIYLPDMKYADPDLSESLSDCRDYIQYNRDAVSEMLRQQPMHEYDESGVLKKGVIIRHLIIPGQVENTLSVLDYICENFGSDVFVSLMSQFFPAYAAIEHPVYSRRITFDEYEQAVSHAEKLGMENVFIQPLEE